MSVDGVKFSERPALTALTVAVNDQIHITDVSAGTAGTKTIEVQELALAIGASGSVGSSTTGQVLANSSGAVVGRAAPAGAIVGTSDTQVITNKSTPDITISSFVNAAHGHTNAAGGGTLAEAALALTDVTTANASTTKHGFLKKLDNASTSYMNGQGNWATPSGGGDALVANPLAQFAATTSAQLRGVISDETGTGALVFATGPTITGLTEAALTLADNTTANASTSAHGFLKKLDNSSVHFMNGQGNWVTPAGAGDAMVANPLSQFAATTSAQLRGVLSDETGTGPAVFATAPNITNPTGLVRGDVGLGNVDNTSDATKNSAAVTVTNHTISGALNTISNLAASAIASGTIAAARLGSGTANSTTVLYGDSVYRTPSSGSGGTVMGHNVLDHGAVGNSTFGAGGGNDDTSAINAAYAAAALPGGTPVVYFPSHRTYRVTSTIDVPQGVHTIGLGGLDGSNTTTPAMIMWDGADGGTLMRLQYGGASMFNALFQNICLCCCSSSVNKPAHLLQFNGTGGWSANVDSGIGLKNIWFLGSVGNALQIDSDTITNFFIEGGRFDAITGGYAIAYQGSGQANINIYGNTNWVGGGATNGKGFMLLDCANGGAAHVKIDGLHTEVNTSLEEIYASGTSPCDKQGIFHLTVDTSKSFVQHRFEVNSWTNNYTSGVKSFSAFLIEGSGTAVACREMVTLVGTNCRGLQAGSTDANATDEVRLIGGKIPLSARNPFTSVNQTAFSWGFGKDSYAEGARAWHYMRHGAMAVRGLSLIGCTVAELETPYLGTYCLEVVTDCTSTTTHIAPVGGGSTKMLCLSSGGGWLTIARAD